MGRVNEPNPSYSISVRLQRVITEQCYVSVPVSDAVMQADPDSDGNWHLDTEKLFTEAIRLGGELGDWRIEERQIGLHPIQGPPPEFESH